MLRTKKIVSNLFQWAVLNVNDVFFFFSNKTGIVFCREIWGNE